MKDVKSVWKEKIVIALNSIKPEVVSNFSIDDVSIETPPKEELGDVAVPLFPFSKLFRMSPNKIAELLLEALNREEELRKYGRFETVGAYLNIFLSKSEETKEIIEGILQKGAKYGSSALLKNKKIMVEFSGPNTNKPLHLGHLRNDVIGESICRLLEFSGADVRRVNIINNRGIHICKSMFAYEKLASGKTPETERVKSDHFVGDLYVAFHNYAKEHPEAEQEVKAMLKEWEMGKNDSLMSLWKRMNDWAMQGIVETYKRTDIRFDKLYFESDTYLKGKDEVISGLNKGVFYKNEDGSTAVDLNPIGIENEKILLRQDGTSLYITQDIGTAIFRHSDWAFDRMIYVVANEQEHHFKVLFYVLKLLGFDWASDMHHLSYGMVNLPEGKMKSREGTVVDADNLLDSLHEEAKKEILEKGHAQTMRDIDDTAEKIALAALHYFLLQISPKKDMLFDPKKSMSFNGNTGPYLQYTGSRISSLLEKATAKDRDDSINDESDVNNVKYSVNFERLKSDCEWTLVKMLSQFPEKVQKAVESMDSSIIATYLYELSRAFSRFYHEQQVITDDVELSNARIALCKATLITLQNGMNLCVLPFVEAM